MGGQGVIVRALIALSVSLLANLMICAGLSQAQENNQYLARLERQTREENVCMLIQKDGRYHLERMTAGRSRVFEGTLEPVSLSELQPLLTAQQLVDLKQSQIDTSGDDFDQVMLTISRSTGWQTLKFPSGKSRKAYKSELDPILKWLDRNKQQQSPATEAVSNRCMPAQATQSASSVSTKNPYMIRVVVDRYEATGSGTAISSVSHASGTAGQTVGGMTNTEAMDLNSYKITRMCAIVYQNGKYRLEKSIRDHGTTLKSEVYREALGKDHLDELRQLLDNPKLVNLANNGTPASLGREGDLITFTVPREKIVQVVSFATLFGPRTQETIARDTAWASLTANVDLTHPVLKWVKQNLEDNKAALVKDASPTTCLPAAQPE